MAKSAIPAARKAGLVSLVRRDWMLLLMVAPVLLYFLVFRYLPMYGLVIAFQKYSTTRGILGSRWVGTLWFEQFFGSIYFSRLMINTLLISLLSVGIGFPIPIVFALMLNEVRQERLKRIIQTTSYLPHFISTVVVVSIMKTLLSLQDGVVNAILQGLGLERINFFLAPGWFRPLYIISEIWQTYGWSSIIYLAALSGIDPSLYEAAQIDGSSRWKNIWYITLPSIMPTIVILLILRLGQVMSVGFEKIILMYNPGTYSVADIISTYTYRRGILEADYSFGAAVGLFNAVIDLVLLLTVNRISKRLADISLW
jgi:putative aldouronate transport system permease protein